jgi:hypothetical protein
VPYFIASHPGSTVEAMIDLALYLKRQRLSPASGAGLHPRADGYRDLHVLHGPRSHDHAARGVARATTDRKMQRALLQFFKPENYFETRRALLSVGRGDLIGDGCDALIPATPPREAIEARMAAARKFDPTAPGADLDQGGYHHAPRRRRRLAIAPAARPPAAAHKTKGTAREGGDPVDSNSVSQ